MQAITKNLDALFAKAGRAEAKRREADARDQAERRREEQRDARRGRKAKAMEPSAAARIWAWVEGPDANNLRARLARTGLPEVRLIGWTNAYARPSTFGGWSGCLCAKPVAVRVVHIAIPVGGRSRIVESRRRFVAETPTEIILALDHAIASRRYLRNVARLASRDIGTPTMVIDARTSDDRQLPERTTTFGSIAQTVGCDGYSGTSPAPSWPLISLGASHAFEARCALLLMYLDAPLKEHTLLQATSLRTARSYPPIRLFPLRPPPSYVRPLSATYSPPLPSRSIWRILSCGAPSLSETSLQTCLSGCCAARRRARGEGTARSGH